MPKILFVLSQRLGWATYSLRLQQAAQGRSDFEPVIYRYDPPKITSLLSKKLHAKSAKQYLGLIDSMQVANLILGNWWQRHGAAIQPDAVHVVTNTLAGIFPQRAAHLPLTVTADCTRRAAQADFGINLFSAADIEREGAVFRAARKIFGYTEWVTSSLIADYGIAAEKAITLRPAAKVQSSPRPHTSGTLPKLGFVGTDFKRKGGHRLIQWHQSHFRNMAELHIVSREAPQVDLPNVILHGAKPNDWITNEFFPMIDIFCFPTSQDMAAQVLVEAAAGGVPTVAYNVGGTSDLVRNGQTGIIVGKGDETAFIHGVRELLTDTDLRHQMADNTLEHAHKYFDADKHFNTLFGEILSGLK